MTDEEYMRVAIKEAKKAEKSDDVPVGAIIVKNGEIIARTHNLKEKRTCATEHAEILAIRKASKELNNWYLDGCTLYVTLEPCPMCAGAVVNSRIDRVVFGAADPKAGCYGSVLDFCKDGHFNHTPEVCGGVLGEECGAILSAFFRKKREEKKKN